MNDDAAYPERERRHSQRRIVAVLAAAWAVEVAILLVSQLAGGPLGLAVHPTGEDRVWIDLLSRPPMETFRGWWAIASRNPLAPWWYEAASPLIAAFAGGLYFARKLLDLLLAVSAALLVDELNQGRRRAFALACGLLVLLWNFSHYVEQILFVMLVALALSLLSVYFYARYLNARRSAGEELGISLLLFLAALATYSIQSGVPLAVALLGFAYGRSGVPRDSGARPLVRNLTDIALFAAMAVLFTQIWITTSGPTSGFFKLDVAHFASQLGPSLANFAWHADTTALVASLLAHWPVALTGAALVAFTLLFLAVLERSGEQSTTDARTLRSTWRDPIWLPALVAICLVMPTVVLEATSTIWFPGSRSRMVQQVFQPLLYMTLTFVLLSPGRKARNAARARALGAAALCAFAVVVGAEYNRQLVQLSAYEQGLLAGLKRYVPSIEKPIHFFVRIDNDDWYGGRNAELNRILVQQAYQSKAVWLDAIFRASAADASTSVVLAAEDKGVFSPATRQYVPYGQAFFASYDGSTLTPLDSVGAAQFAGYQVKVLRHDDHVQDLRALAVVPGCPSSFDFDVAPRGRGWSVPETSAAGDSFVWMAATRATVDLRTTCTGPLQLTLRTLQPMAADIQASLALDVRGTPVPIEITRTQNGITEYRALLPQGASSGGTVSLGFSVSRTITAPGGARELAVPFDWIRLTTVDTSAR